LSIPISGYGISRAARHCQLLQNSHNEVWLLPVSVWETLVLAQKGRINLTVEPDIWVHDALLRWPVKRAPLTFEIAIKSLEIDLPHNDPADRFIAATSLTLGLALMTVDKRLLSCFALLVVKKAR